MGDNFNVRIIDNFDLTIDPIIIKVNPNTNVLELKLKYSRERNLKTINYILIFEGTVLNTIDESSRELKKLSDYRITKIYNNIHYVGEEIFEPYLMVKNYGETAIGGGDIKNIGNKKGVGLRKKRKKRKKTKKKPRKELKR
jgi:hypothetical protein